MAGTGGGHTYVALLRGINVGRAKQVPMADLRAAIEDLGHTAARTVLRSGNAVFASAGPLPAGAAGQLRDAVARRTGVTSEVVLLTAQEFEAVVRDNPLLAAMTDPARMQVAFLGDPADLPVLRTLERDGWEPEAYAVGQRVAYLWCPDGVLAGRLPQALAGLPTRGTVTTRNWSTVQKLLAQTAAG